MRNPPLYFSKLIKELNNTNITKKFEISKYLWKYFVFFFVADLGFEPRQAITVSRLWASRFTITLIRNVIGCEGLDLNQRPLAYETSELPDCSTPQCLAMMEGLEPPFPIGQLLWRITFLFLHLISSRGASIPLPCHIIVFICLLCLLI